MSPVAVRGAEKRVVPARRDPSGRCTRAGAERSSAERLRLIASDAQAGGRLTLEQRLDGVWEGLRAGRAVACPVCQTEMALADGAVAARCATCGSTLS